MHNQDLGRVAVVARGIYDPSAEYERLDAVSYNGNSFLVRKHCQGVEPAEGEYYMLLAQAGDSTAANAAAAEALEAAKRANASSSRADTAAGNAEQQGAAATAAAESANTAAAAAQNVVNSVQPDMANVKQTLAAHGEALDNRIKKFYTGNLGAVNVADSDDGAVRNLVIGGRSEQISTNGYQLINQVISSGSNQIRVDTINNGFVITTLSEGVYRQGSANVSPRTVEAGKYTLSAKVTGIGGIIFRFIGSGGIKLAEVTIYSANKSAQIEIGDRCEVQAVLLGSREYVVGIGTVTTITDIMLEPGSIAHEWEPYTGGAPSPSPDYPQEIRSVENCTMTVSNSDGTKTQEAAIPFSLHGNGDVRDELYVYADGTGKLVRRYPETLDPTRTVAEQALDMPVETTLTANQVNALFALHTYYGGTNISYQSENGVEPAVNFDYACSLENFVEYIKAAQGDNRKFIYDMDERMTDAEYVAAMAYVNSEYATALTELEV